MRSFGVALAIAPSRRVRREFDEDVADLYARCLVVERVRQIARFEAWSRRQDRTWALVPYELVRAKTCSAIS